MARKQTPQQGPTAVEAITHRQTRANIPTADAHNLLPPDVEEIIEVTYPREIRSPMLVWKGKEELDDEDLCVDAPPIYIQEKIDPRVLIENLRKTVAAAGESEPEQTLFEAFDGLNELDLVEFYKHSANWSNRVILGDSLQVMASLAERERLRGKVQMIYLDPPYGIKFGSNWQVSARKREVTDGKTDHVARDAEQVKAFRDTWELGIHSYLSYLRDRLQVGRDLLTESGSVFVQIGAENVHLVRSLLDEVMGSENFVSLISFVTTSGFTSSTTLSRNGDYLVWYAKAIDKVKIRRQWVAAPDRQGYRWLCFADGTSRGMKRTETLEDLPAGCRLYQPDNLKSQGGAGTDQTFEHLGKTYTPGANSHWKASLPAGMARLAAANRIHVARNIIRYRRFVDDFPYQVRGNFWTDTGSSLGGDKIYVVQTNTKVVERCLLLATDPGDLVLDPTCGSGTTAFVAERWGRRWITIDSSRVALALCRQRLAGARFPYFMLADSPEGRAKESEVANKKLAPAETTNDVRQGFVYERVPHITLSSIANNPDIHAGMTPAAIDAAITRHADSELLYDKPYSDPGKVRVTGPFTVESLSPHRNLAGLDDRSNPACSERSRPGYAEASFEQIILENLGAAGVQNGRKAERIEFDLIEGYAGSYVQAIGIRQEQGGGRAEAGWSVDRAAVRNGGPAVRQERGPRSQQG